MLPRHSDAPRPSIARGHTRPLLHVVTAPLPSDAHKTADLAALEPCLRPVSLGTCNATAKDPSTHGPELAPADAPLMSLQRLTQLSGRSAGSCPRHEYLQWPP